MATFRLLEDHFIANQVLLAGTTQQTADVPGLVLVARSTASQEVKALTVLSTLVVRVLRAETFFLNSAQTNGVTKMVEIKTCSEHPASMADRISKRLRNSGGVEADTVTKTGDGPTRVFHNIHHPGSARQHGKPDDGDRAIDGSKRGVV